MNLWLHTREKKKVFCPVCIMWYENSSFLEVSTHYLIEPIGSPVVEQLNPNSDMSRKHSTRFSLIIRFPLNCSIVTQKQAENCLSCHNSRLDLWPHGSFMFMSVILCLDYDFKLWEPLGEFPCPDFIGGVIWRLMTDTSCCLGPPNMTPAWLKAPEWE